MPETNTQTAAQLTAATREGCQKCQCLKTVALALTAAEYGLPPLLKALPIRRNTQPPLAVIYTKALDQARRNLSGPAAASFLQASQALARAMTPEPVNPEGSWTALESLHATTLAFIALEGPHADLPASLEASTNLLATDPDLSDLAARFIAIECSHPNPVRS